ncbi:hypothetical protein [Streptomyces sp. WMMB303]|uniref:hypothetical protein n=1 Tax=Streptomyces sp. WMMB303 TaxID=3034154 RepID=UPI0023ED61A7|nr:hypothetical protein [Streptomyces sp. WMMB303]MDF4250096.1 hypothetical protein [Streptomyces sp. WMMB303]
MFEVTETFSHPYRPTRTYAEGEAARCATWAAIWAHDGVEEWAVHGDVLMVECGDGAVVMARRV